MFSMRCDVLYFFSFCDISIFYGEGIFTLLMSVFFVLEVSSNFSVSSLLIPSSLVFGLGRSGTRSFFGVLGIK